MKLKCIFILTFAMIFEIPAKANSELPAIISGYNVDSTNTNQASQNKNTEYKENILCRGCGSDISSNNFIISKLSPASLFTFNDTLFNKESVLVQVVSNDYIFQFPVIVFEQSTCVGIGELQILSPGTQRSYKDMTSSEALSNDEIFLASCEELLKDRYTENDEEFMKVMNAEPSMPPIVESWWVPSNSGRRNDRRSHRRPGPYRGRDYQRGYDDRSYGHNSQRPRY